MSIINLGHHSWHDFVAHATKRLTAPAIFGADSGSSEDGNAEFRGTSTLREAIELAVHGWQEGARAIAKVLDTLPPSSEVLPDWQLDVAGTICNVPAFIAGEPECMWNMSECKRNEHRVVLVVPGTYGGHIEQAEAQRYAIAVAAVVRSLEASGINPAVYSIPATVGHRGRGNRHISSVAVREFGEPLDLSKVATAFHPSFLRRVQFAWREMTPEAVTGGIANDGYGAASVPTRDEITALLGDVGYVVLAPSVQQAIYREDVIAYMRGAVLDQIKQLR
jgi:hypothetical protein